MLAFKPELFAVLVADGLIWLLALLALPTAWRVLRHWDPGAADGRQLRLESQAGLFGGVASVAMVLKVPALVLFVAATDRLADQITGAMCPFGVLQAGPVGWASLGLRLTSLLLLGLWWTSQALARRDEDGRHAPLRARLFALLFVALSLELAATSVFLVGLRLDSPVSCCATVFSESGAGVLQTLLSLPTWLTLSLYFGLWSLLLVSAVAGWLRFHGWASLAFLPVSLIALIQVFSPSIYALPHHHCPFCLLKAEYACVGYLYYFLLLLGSGSGLAVGYAQAFLGVRLGGVRWLSLACSSASLVLLSAFPLVHRLSTGVWL